jgi:glycosyltransferase involved in cell wall biosynthesis
MVEVKSIHTGRLKKWDEVDVKTSCQSSFDVINPKVSVVVANYNYGRFLEETILSVLKQDYENLELVIVDGNSKDNSLDIIKKYGDDPRVVWVSEEDEGNLPAVNKGIEMSSGEIIGVLHSSDTYTQGCITKVVEVFKNNPDASYVGGQTNTINDDSIIVEIEDEFISREIYEEDFLTFQNYPSIMASFFSKDLLVEVGGFFHSCHTNTFMLYFLHSHVNKYRVLKSKEILANYRLHDHEGYDDWGLYKSMVYSHQRRDTSHLIVDKYKSELSLFQVNLLEQGSVFDELQRRMNKHRQYFSCFDLISKYLSSGGKGKEILMIYLGFIKRVLMKVLRLKSRRGVNAGITPQEKVSSDWYSAT